jgi:hypothetical protein
VGRHVPSTAEQNFFATFLGEGVSKIAVDLDPSVAEALDVPTGSPSILRSLEDQAPAADASNASPGDASSEEEAPPDEQQLDAVEQEAAQVASFDRNDPEGPQDDDIPEPDLPSRRTHGRLFTDKRAHPLQILDVLTMRYHTEWAGWEPPTLWWALRRDFGPVGEVARNKIMALRIAATTDVPWLDWDVFEDSGLAWNDTIPVIGAFQPMSPAQTAFAVHVLRSIRDDEEFDAEVIAYIASILEDHGWVYAPEEFFGPVQQLLDRKKWLVGFKQEVATVWEQIKDVDPTTIEWRDDHPLDIHLLKLAVVKSYLTERQALREAVPGAAPSSSTTTPPVP